MCLTSHSQECQSCHGNQLCLAQKPMGPKRGKENRPYIAGPRSEAEEGWGGKRPWDGGFNSSPPFPEDFKGTDTMPGPATSSHPLPKRPDPLLFL